MKKTILFSIFVLILGFAPHVFAQGFVPLAPIPGLTDINPTSAIGANTLAVFFNNLYKYLIGLAAVVAVIQIIWAGLEMAYYHRDSVSAITDDKGKIWNAILGLILVLSPALVFSIINPSILNLSVNLPALKTMTTSNTAETVAPATTVQGGNPNLSQLSSFQQALCLGYSQFKTVQVPAGQYCKDVLGTGWVRVDDVCSDTGAAQSGYEVCGLTSTTQQAQTGCTTTHYGEYFETAVCTTSNFAASYLCKNGQKPTIQNCSTMNAQGGCIGNINIYCAKDITVLYYAATYHLVGALISSATVVPRDAQIQNTFSSVCSAGGGKLDISTSKGLVGSLQFANAVPGNCPADAMVPNFTTTGGTTGQTGVTCYNRILSCTL